MDYEKKQRIYKTIMLVVVIALITFVITSVLTYKYASERDGHKYIVVSGGNDSKVSLLLKSFKEIIDEDFLGEVDEEKLTQGALKGYIDALDDPYTEYFTKEEMEEFEAQALGNFVGIGIYMARDIKNNTIVVISPIEDTPAYKAGIQPGDIISKVDGVKYSGEDMDVVASKIKGEEGTKVSLEILRNGKTLNFDIAREKIKVNHIEADVLENNIGYLRLSSFDEGCADEFEKKYTELTQKNITSLIIDLRNNGGGIVDEALDILNLIVDKDDITLITVDKNKKEEIDKNTKDPIINLPIVLLVNENSASASEIVAGALKDNGKAKIVGTTTFGKGVIQELLSLSDGSGLKITTNEYYTPSKNKINEIGIEPDEKVELPKNVDSILNVDKKDDTQLKKAIEILKNN